MEDNKEMYPEEEGREGKRLQRKGKKFGKTLNYEWTQRLQGTKIC